MSLLCFCCVCCYDGGCLANGKGLSAVAVRMEPAGWWSGGTENPVTASTGSFFFFWCAGSWLPPAFFSSCSGRGSSLAAVCGFSLHVLLWAQALRRADFSSYGTWAQWWRPWPLDHRLSSRDDRFGCCEAWGFSWSELQPASPALAGGFLTTDPPRKPLQLTVRPLPIYYVHLSRLQAIYKIMFSY